MVRPEEGEWWRPSAAADVATRQSSKRVYASQVEMDSPRRMRCCTHLFWVSVDEMYEGLVLVWLACDLRSLVEGKIFERCPAAELYP